jgi:hypothetical protein
MQNVTPIVHAVDGGYLQRIKAERDASEQEQLASKGLQRI